MPRPGLPRMAAVPPHFDGGARGLHTAVKLSPPTVFLGACSVLLLSYVLFQRKLLPEPIGRQVGRLFFWPTVPFTVASRWSNYFTQMGPTLILGAAPLHALDHPALLYSKGVRGVVNMCDEYRGPIADYKRLGIRQLRLPTVDHTEPESYDLMRGVRFIRDFASRNEKVLVHCKAGHGRGAAMAMAWLLSQDAPISPMEVQLYMNERRNVRHKLYLQADIQNFYSQLQAKEQDSANGGKQRKLLRDGK